MDIYGGSSYWLVKLFLTKGLALTYLVAFTVAFKQYKGLLGEKGILPLENFVEKESIWNSLSLFHFFPSDRAINLTALTGIILSFTLLLGIPSKISSLGASLTWILLWFLFLSFVNTGQKFYEHGWELILLEAGFLAAFLGGLNTQASEILIWLFRWLLFRMMLGSGLIKLHGDSAWKDLSALKYHYETQPFPNPLSWYIDKLPEKILETGVIITHFMLLIVPFLYFAPQPYAAFAGVLTIIYQLMIFAGGNYAWLNLVTVVLAFSLFNNEILISLTAGLFSQPVISAYPYGKTPLILAGFVGVMSLPVLKNMFSSDQTQNKSFDCLHLVNSYGAFLEVPRQRKEIVLECSENKNPDDGDWKEIRFKGKPSNPLESPGQVSPYFHRLDYPFWFTARNQEDTDWLENLMEKLLSGSKEVRKLFMEVPVEEPEKVRATIFSYRFTSRREKEETGRWWLREPEKTIVEK